MSTEIQNPENSMIIVTYSRIADQIIENCTVEKEQFSGCRLENTEFNKMIFIDCDFQATCFLETNFIDCMFINCNFSFSSLRNCSLVACTFENCTFCITNSLNSNYQACTFQNNIWNLGTYNNNRMIDCYLDEADTLHLQDGSDNILEFLSPFCQMVA